MAARLGLSRYVLQPQRGLAGTSEPRLDCRPMSVVHQVLCEVLESANRIPVKENLRFCAVKFGLGACPSIRNVTNIRRFINVV